MFISRYNLDHRTIAILQYMASPSPHLGFRKKKKRQQKYMITTSELDWYRYLWTVCWPTLAIWHVSDACAVSGLKNCCAPQALVQSATYVLSFSVISVVCQREPMYISVRVELRRGARQPPLFSNSLWPVFIGSVVPDACMRKRECVCVMAESDRIGRSLNQRMENNPSISSG